MTGSLTPYWNYNDSTFRTQFVAFANVTTFPEATLQMNWNTAGNIIANTSYGFLASQGGSLPISLMTAHLTALSVMIANGELPSIAVAAGIDKINVTLMPPPLKDQFAYWLCTTPYGQQLYAMLQVAAVGGLYSPGGLGTAGFNAGPNSGYGCW